MSRVLVVGMGVPSLVPARRHAGPGLRSAHFARALARSGHEVLLVSVLARDEAAPDARCTETGIEFFYVTEESLASAATRATIDAFDADAVVGVTAYAAALAVRLDLSLPLWADVFGDLMAEAQAKAARLGSDWSLVHFWGLLGDVLEHADRFSAVSAAQSHALVGQLGLAGRLSSRTAGEDLVAVIPCAADVPEAAADRGAARRELGLGAEDFAVLISGGVNTWCDVETLAAGLASAMAGEPRLHIVVTGGAIPGHDEASHASLVAALRGLDPSRLHLLGWIDSSLLASVYAASDLGVVVERKLYERRLGAENRVVEWLAHGLPCVTTGLSESGADLVDAGLALACRAGDAGDLARALSSAAHSPARLAELRRRGLEWIRERRGVDVTASPLVAWCAAPVFAGDRHGSRLVRIGLVSHPETKALMLEAYVAALPIGELARRALRYVVRRAWRATGARLAAAGRAEGVETAPARTASRSERA